MTTITIGAWLIFTTTMMITMPTMMIIGIMMTMKTFKMDMMMIITWMMNTMMIITWMIMMMTITWMIMMMIIMDMTMTIIWMVMMMTITWMITMMIIMVTMMTTTDMMMTVLMAKRKGNLEKRVRAKRAKRRKILTARTQITKT